MTELAGKVVLLTGATDGMGRALAVDLARAGATVLVHGRDPERIAATVAEVAAASREAPAGSEAPAAAKRPPAPRGRCAPTGRLYRPAGHRLR